MKKIYTAPVFKKIDSISKKTLGNTGSTTLDGSGNGNGQGYSS